MRDRYSWQSQSIRYDLGRIMELPEERERDAALRAARPFILSDEDLATHMLILGRTGSGKSRYLLQILRYHFVSRRGFCLIEPGDLTEDLLAYACRKFVETGDREWLQRIHFVDPSDYRMAVRWNPLRFDQRGIPVDYRENARRAWLHAEAQRLGELVQLKQGGMDFAGMARLQRVLTGVFKAAGTALDRDGRHLPLADALLVLTPEHPQHDRIFAVIAPKLDPDTRSDLMRLRSYRRTEDRMRECESTINRLRSLLSPQTQAMFSDSGVSGDVLDVGRVIRDGGVLLWQLRPGRFFSNDQKITLGQLACHEVISAMQAVPRAQRRPFTMAIDEAGELMNDEINWALGAMRKFGLRIILAGQDLSSFVRKDADYRSKVLSQPGTIVCFEQRFPDDLEILSRVLGQGNIDYTELTHEVDRHDGYDFVPMTERSRALQRQVNWSSALSVGATESESEQQSLSRTTQESWNASSGSQTGRSVNSGWSETVGSSDAEGHGDQRTVRGDQMLALPTRNDVQTGRSTSSQRSTNRATGRSGSEALSEGTSTQTGVGGGTGESIGASKGNGRARTVSDSENAGGALSLSWSESRKLVPLARIRVERQRTGQLERSVADQLEKIRSILHGLRQRRAMIKRQAEAKAFVAEIHNVPDPFVSPEAQAQAIDWMKRELWATHGYFFTPSFGPDEQTERLEALLADIAVIDPCGNAPSDRTRSDAVERLDDGAPDDVEPDEPILA